MSTDHTPLRNSTQPPTIPAPLTIQQYHIELNKNHNHSFIFPIVAASLLAFSILGIITERVLNLSLHRSISRKVYTTSGICLINATPFVYLAVKSITKYEADKKNLLATAFTDLQQLKTKRMQKNYIEKKFLIDPDRTKKRFHHTTQLHYLKNLKAIAIQEKNKSIEETITREEKELQKALANP